VSFRYRLFRAVARVDFQYPWLVLLACAALAVVSVFYTKAHLQFQTGQEDLISGNGRDTRNYRHYEDEFPDLDSLIMVVRAGRDPAGAERFADAFAARLAADVMGVSTLIMARTDADSATLITSDVDPRDREFLTGERTTEGFFRCRKGLPAAIARGLAYAPYADLLWCETAKPDLEEARIFAEGIHARFPDKMLAYNCSPSFNWKKHLDDATIARFQTELAAMGYKFQFITLAGFHSLNMSMFDLARQYRQSGMTAYCRLQEEEFRQEREYGYEAVKHQKFVGTGYFDSLQQAISGGTASTTALEGSTEAEQFTPSKAATPAGNKTEEAGRAVAAN
jgi:isocitrate lyase